MALDWTNPLPIALGGDPTDCEEIWRALRSAEGGEHGPGPEHSSEDVPRQIIATALAGADRAIERAFLQAFPGAATDALPLWEEILRSDGANTDVELRALLASLWRPPNGATTPHLAQDLLDISAQLAIEIEAPEFTDTTVPGKHVAPEGNVPDYGAIPAAHYPNYASRDVLRVVYTLASGETEIPDEVVRAVTKRLKKRLPSQQTWTLGQKDPDDGGAFRLDGGFNGNSVLDVTPLG